MVGTRLLGATLLASMVLLAGCRDRPPRVTPGATATATAASAPVASATATTTASQPMWDARAVTAKPDAYFRVPCPAAADPARGNPGQVFNLDTPAAVECVLAAMRVAGTTEEARAFLARYRTFLVGFEERGRVDLGTTSAAWVNMGRPEPVFVNAGPEGMTSLQAIAYGGAPSQQAARGWLAQPEVVAALRGQDATAWPEYARVAAIEAGTGRQRFLASIPARVCRACATLLELQVVFEFGADGAVVGIEPRPPLAASAVPGSTPGGALL